MDENQADALHDGGQDNQPQVAVQKIYVRDASVEVPEGPRIFTQQFNPEVNVDLNTRVEGLGDNAYQVVLSVTVTAKQEDTTVYIVEIQQAGVFQLQGLDDEDQRGHVLGAYCPGVLFPFVREAASDMVQRAGFPPFLLQPVNFDALYQQQQQGGAADEATTH